MEDLKQIIEIIHPNETIRTYAVTKVLPRKEEGVLGDSYVRSVDKVHPELAPLVSELLSKPYIDHLDMRKTSITVHATDAFEDLWDKFHDEITRIINFYIFDGQAEVRIRDDKAKYEAARTASAFPRI